MKSYYIIPPLPSDRDKLEKFLIIAQNWNGTKSKIEAIELLMKIWLPSFIMITPFFFRYDSLLALYSSTISCLLGIYTLFYWHRIRLIHLFLLSNNNEIE